MSRLPPEPRPSGPPSSFRPGHHEVPPGRAAWPGALLLLGLCAAFPGAAPAQTGFTEYALPDTTLNSDPSTDFWISSAAPADVDADGDLDLLVAGYYVVYFGDVEERLTLYRNDGQGSGLSWNLTPIPLDATGLYFNSADLAWGDYDNDGDPDVLVGAYGDAVLYRNDAGSLIRTSTALPGYVEDSDFSTMDLHSISWGDVDNDGDLDLLLPSVSDFYDVRPTVVLRNDGPGMGTAWIFTEMPIALPVAMNAVSNWADMEGDGDLDLLLANVSPYGDNFLRTYRNSGGTLSVADPDLAFIRYGMTDWGDVDADGDLDIVYGGNLDLPDGTGETVVRILFKNPGAGYTPVDVVESLGSGEPWLDFNAVAWADYDSDGDMDLLVSGEWLGPGEIEGRAVIYANSGGSFTLASSPLPAPIAGNSGGAFTWFDVDSDGDLDYFVAGGYYVPNGNGLIEARAQLFRNDAPGVNQPPQAPSGLVATPLGPAAVRLAWQPSSDDQTPVTALTYELEVVPAGNGSPPERVLPERGNVSRNIAWSLSALTPGSYRWSVRAVDSAFNGSPQSQGSFTVGVSATPEPTTGNGLAVSAPFPNPAGATARFTLSLDRAQGVTVGLFDVAGRRVRGIHAGLLTAGTHEFRVDGADLDSGVYFIRATSPEGTIVRRLALAR